MTVVVGLKCIDGPVIATDSQSEYSRGVDVKRLNSNKLYELDGKYLLAGAGVLAHIHVLVDNVKSQLKNQENSQRCSELNKDETENTVEQVLWTLVRHYNMERGGFIGTAEREFFTPIAILAGGYYENDDLKYYCDILHCYDGTIEPIEDYGAAGSGAAYAELLLKSLYYKGITVDEGIKVAAYVINEVISIDPHCGGDIQLGFIKSINDNGKIKSQLSILPHKDITELLEQIKPKLDSIRTNLVAAILRGELDDNKIKEISKNP